MTKLKQEERDKAALDNLREWLAPLSLEVADDGYSLYLNLSFSHKRVYLDSLDEAKYRSWISGEQRRSKAAAANEISRAISKGTGFYTKFHRTIEMPDGSTLDDARTYAFRIPKSSTPEELALKLGLAGWKPPEDAWSLK
jgi:hypothetical protein